MKLLTDERSLIDISTYYGVPYTSQGLECIPKLLQAQAKLTREEWIQAGDNLLETPYWRGKFSTPEISTFWQILKGGNDAIIVINAYKSRQTSKGASKTLRSTTEEVD